MRMIRMTLALATALLAVPAVASAATTATTAPVTAAVADTLTVAAATPAALAIVPGTTSTAVSAVVTITDTTPLTPHSLEIADLASGYSGGVYPSGHTAGHMDRQLGTGPASLANALEWSADNSAFSALTGANQTVGATGVLAVDPRTVWFRQTANTAENLVAGDVYGLTATYTVNG